MPYTTSLEVVSVWLNKLIEHSGGRIDADMLCKAIDDDSAIKDVDGGIVLLAKTPEEVKQLVARVQKALRSPDPTGVQEMIKAVMSEQAEELGLLLPSSVEALLPSPEALGFLYISSLALVYQTAMKTQLAFPIQQGFSELPPALLEIIKADGEEFAKLLRKHAEALASDAFNDFGILAVNALRLFFVRVKNDGVLPIGPLNLFETMTLTVEDIRKANLKELFAPKVAPKSMAEIQLEKGYATYKEGNETLEEFGARQHSRNMDYLRRACNPKGETPDTPEAPPTRDKDVESPVPVKGLAQTIADGYQLGEDMKRALAAKGKDDQAASEEALKEITDEMLPEKTAEELSTDLLKVLRNAAVGIGLGVLVGWAIWG